MTARRVASLGFAFVLPTLLLVHPLPASAVDEAAAPSIQKTFTANPGGKLVLRADRGSVTLTGSKESRVEIEVTRKVVRGSGEKATRLLEEHKVTFAQDGPVIRIEAALPGGDRWTSWLNPQLEVNFTIAVPREFNVDIETAGGSVRAGDLKGDLILKTSGGSLQLETLAGKIQARTSGGSIKATHLAGIADLHTSGGSIRVEDATGEQLKVHTSGGSLDLTRLAAPTEAHTSGGSIHVETSTAPLNADTSGGSISAVFSKAPKAPATLKTSAGGINLTLPGDAPFNLDASTSAGSVRSEIPIPVTRDSDDRNSLKGPANGGGPLLKLRTSAGSIRIRKS